MQSRSAFRTLAKNRTISPPPPSRQGRLFPPCRGNPVISLCVLRGSLLRRPVKLGSVDPHAMQNDRELTCDCNLSLAEPVALGEPYSPGLHGGPFWDARQQNPGCFKIDNFAAWRRRISRSGRTNRPPRKRGACWLARYKHLRFSIAQTAPDRQSLP